METVLDQPVSRVNKANYQFTADGLPICLRCRKPGHVLRQCRQGQRPQASSVPSDRPEYNPAPAAVISSGMGFAEESIANDHIVNDGHPKQAPPLANNLRPLIGTCHVVEVQMGGVMVKCLLDTGSMVTTITESLSHC